MPVLWYNLATLIRGGTEMSKIKNFTMGSLAVVVSLGIAASSVAGVFALRRRDRLQNMNNLTTQYAQWHKENTRHCFESHPVTKETSEPTFGLAKEVSNEMPPFCTTDTHVTSSSAKRSDDGYIVNYREYDVNDCSGAYVKRGK